MKNVNVVAAIICDDYGDKKKVLATQRGYGEFKDGWEFPGGKIEEGETPETEEIAEGESEESVRDEIEGTEADKGEESLADFEQGTEETEPTDQEEGFTGSLVDGFNPVVLITSVCVLIALIVVAVIMHFRRKRL